MARFKPKLTLSKRTGSVLVHLSPEDMKTLADEYYEYAMSQDYPWDPGDLNQYFIGPGKKGLSVIYRPDADGSLKLERVAPRLQLMLDDDYVWVQLQAAMLDYATRAGVEQALVDAGSAMQQAIESGVLGQKPRDVSLRGTAMPFGTQVRKGLGKGGRMGTAMPFGTGAIRIKNPAVRVSHRPRFSWGPEFRVDFSPKDVDRFVRKMYRDGEWTKPEALRAVEVLKPARKRGVAIVFNEQFWPVAGDQRSIPRIRSWEVWDAVLEDMLPYMVGRILADAKRRAKKKRGASRSPQRGAVPAGGTGALQFGTAQFSGTQMRPATGMALAGRGGVAPAFQFGTAGAAPELAEGPMKFGGGRRGKNPESRRLRNRLTKK